MLARQTRRFSAVVWVASASRQPYQADAVTLTRSTTGSSLKRNVEQIAVDEGHAPCQDII